MSARALPVTVRMPKLARFARTDFEHSRSPVSREMATFRAIPPIGRFRARNPPRTPLRTCLNLQVVQLCSRRLKKRGVTFFRATCTTAQLASLPVLTPPRKGSRRSQQKKAPKAGNKGRESMASVSNTGAGARARRSCWPGRPAGARRGALAPHTRCSRVDSCRAKQL